MDPVPSVSEIIEGQLFLGNLGSAKSPELLSSKGITHIVSVCHELASSPLADVKHLGIAVKDSEYEDLLINLPRACAFIQEALEQHRGRVLVHCVMGVSRSTTVVAAYLMRNCHMSPSAALSFIRRRRPQAHPNYGFVRQLDIFAQCNYDASPTNLIYSSWKHTHKKHMDAFLSQVADTIPIIPDSLFLSSTFPADPKQAECLLLDLGITHVISISPSKLPQLPSNIQHRHAACKADSNSDTNGIQHELLFELVDSCNFIKDATNRNEPVLVHSLRENRACIIVCAYFMTAQSLTLHSAIEKLELALPLFYPTSTLKRHLELFRDCDWNPSPEHPLLIDTAPLRQEKTEARVTEDLAAKLMTSLLGETKVDVSAFAETVVGIHRKAGAVARVRTEA